MDPCEVVSLSLSLSLSLMPTVPIGLLCAYVLVGGIW